MSLRINRERQGPSDFPRRRRAARPPAMVLRPKRVRLIPGIAASLHPSSARAQRPQCPAVRGANSVAVALHPQPVWPSGDVSPGRYSRGQVRNRDSSATPPRDAGIGNWGSGLPQPTVSRGLRLLTRFHTVCSAKGGTTMGYARYIGRVGALAAALGVATMVASTPGVALAEEEPGSDNPPSSSNHWRIRDFGAVGRPLPNPATPPASDPAIRSVVSNVASPSALASASQTIGSSESGPLTILA